MSTEYHTGEQKAKILDKIAHYLAIRMTSSEMLDSLKGDGIEISDRTLRRYKLEIRDACGRSIEQIFINRILKNTVSDVLAYELMQRECWKSYYEARRIQEALKALTCLRIVTSDKIKLLKNIPKKFHESDLQYNNEEDTEPPKNSEKTPKETFKEVKSIIKDNNKFLEELQKVSGTKIHL